MQNWRLEGVGHLGIWPNGNLTFQKVSFLYEVVGLISKIFKIYMFYVQWRL